MRADGKTAFHINVETVGPVSVSLTLGNAHPPRRTFSSIFLAVSRVSALSHFQVESSLPDDSLPRAYQSRDVIIVAHGGNQRINDDYLVRSFFFSFSVCLTRRITTDPSKLPPASRPISARGLISKNQGEGNPPSVTETRDVSSDDNNNDKICL